MARSSEEINSNELVTWYNDADDRWSLCDKDDSVGDIEDAKNSYEHSDDNNDVGEIDGSCDHSYGNAGQYNDDYRDDSVNYIVWMKIKYYDCVLSIDKIGWCKNKKCVVDSEYCRYGDYTMNIIVSHKYS